MTGDELEEGLKYIINSPKREYGAFDPQTVAVAKAARDAIDTLCDKLTNCWLLLDTIARSRNMVDAHLQDAAKSLLQSQQVPGWNPCKPDKVS